ncbi:MAG: DUF4153 domain-containing protein [Pricia sp.]|nr:DUF4153 domain-containing protein [Pricia sp.]
MNFLSFPELTDKAQNAFKRFPLTLLWALIGTLSFMYFIHEDEKLFEEQLGICLMFILGISWLMGTQFLIEQLGRPKKGMFLKLIVVGLLLAFYWHLPEGTKIDDTPAFFIRFFLYFIAGHLFVLFAPFLLKWHKVAYWNYLKSTAMALSRSAFFSGVLFLGLVLTLAAIDALFEVNIPGQRYGQLFIFCVGVVNTWIYLSDFPLEIHQNTSIHFQKALEVLVKYILIPLVILYVLILYVYGLKIVLQWELPQGRVSYLITALAFLGFIVQVIINPVQKTLASWAINRFHPWFYILLLPPTVLLFVAIFRRIADYGITEKRYFVMVLAFWIAAMTLYLLFTKKKNLIVLPISLFALTLLSSFGFWGVLPVSINSQLRQFEKVFNEVNTQNKIASTDQFRQLKSIILYVNERESLSKLNHITGIDMQNAFKDTANGLSMASRRIDTRKVMDSLGISVNPENLANVPPFGTHYNYYADQNRVNEYDIRNFNYFATIRFHSQAANKMEIGDFYIHFNSEQVNLLLVNKNDSSRTLQIPLRSKLLQLSKRGVNLGHPGEKEMTLEVKADSVTAKLIVTELDYTIKQDSIHLIHSSAYLFLKQ